MGGFLLVPGLGFEPRLPGPEPGVLPLDDPGMWLKTIMFGRKRQSKNQGSALVFRYFSQTNSKVFKTGSKIRE